MTTPPDDLDRLAAKKDGRPDRSVPTPEQQTIRDLRQQLADRDTLIQVLRAVIDRKDFEIRAVRHGLDARAQEITRLQFKIDDMLGRARG